MSVMPMMTTTTIIPTITPAAHNTQLHNTATACVVGIRCKLSVTTSGSQEVRVPRMSHSPIASDRLSNLYDSMDRQKEREREGVYVIVCVHT